MKEEVRLVLRSMKKVKTVGEDDVELDMIIALGDFAIDELTKIFNRIFEFRNYVKSTCESLFITLPEVEGS